MTRQPRIVIEDLPTIEPLTEEQMAEIFGAGKYHKPTRLGLEMLESRQMAAADAGFCLSTLELGHDEGEIAPECPLPVAPAGYQRDSVDVDGDNVIAAFDVLLTINFINSRVASMRGADRGLDVDFDGEVTPSDTIRIINRINSQRSTLDDRSPAGAVVDAKWADDGTFARTILQNDGTTIRETFSDNQLKKSEATQAGQTVRTSWGDGGAVLRQKLNEDQPQLEEEWDSGTFRQTAWKDDGAIERKTFQDGKLKLQESWNGNGQLVRKVVDGSGNLLAQQLVNGKVVSEDATIQGAYSVHTTTGAAGEVVREYSLGGRVVLREETNRSGGRVRTSIAENGDTLKQSFVDGRETVEESWDVLGNRQRIEWSGDSTVSIQVWRQGQPLVAEQWQGGAGFVRTTWKPDAFRQTFRDGRQVGEQSVSATGNIVSTNWLPDGSVLRTTASTGGTVKLEERWSATGGFERTTYSGKMASKATIVIEKYQDGVPVSRETQTWQNNVQVENLLQTVTGPSPRPTNHFVRTTWDSAGNKQRDTIELLPSSGEARDVLIVVLREQWNDSTGTYIKTSCPILAARSRVQFTREEFRNGVSVVTEIWDGSNYTRATWDSVRKLSQQTFVASKEVSDEQWPTPNVYIVTKAVPGQIPEQVVQSTYNGTTLIQTTAGTLNAPFVPDPWRYGEEAKGITNAPLNAAATPPPLAMQDVQPTSYTGAEVNSLVARWPEIAVDDAPSYARIAAADARFKGIVTEYSLEGDVQQLLDKLAALKTDSPDEVRARIEVFVDKMNDLVKWEQDETQRLQAQQNQINDFRSKLEKAVQDFKSTWQTVKTQVQIQRNFMVGGTQDPKQSQRGFSPGTTTETPAQRAIRIKAVYDPILAKVTVLQDVANYIKQMKGNFADQFQSVVANLNSGIATYFQATQDATKSRTEALNSINSKVDTQIKDAEATAQSLLALYSEGKSKEITPLEKQRDDATYTYNRKLYLAQQDRDAEIAEPQVLLDGNDGGTSGFFLGGGVGAVVGGASDFWNGLKEGGKKSVAAAKDTGGDFSDVLKNNLGNIAEWGKEEWAKARQWANDRIAVAKKEYSDAEKAILKKRDEVLAPINKKLDDANKRWNKSSDDAKKKRDDTVTEAKTWQQKATTEVNSIYDKAAEQAQEQLFDVANDQLASAMGTAASALSVNVDALAQIQVNNPFGTIAEGLSHFIGDTGDMLVNGLKEAGGIISDAGKQLMQGTLESAQDLSHWAGDRWDAFADAWHDNNPFRAGGPLSPRPHRERKGISEIELLKLDHGYNTDQATIVYQLVFKALWDGLEPGLEGKYQVEFDQIAAQALSEVCQGWLTSPNSLSAPLSVDGLLQDIARIAQNRFLDKYELNADGSPRVRYINGVPEEQYFKDNPPPERHSPKASFGLDSGASQDETETDAYKGRFDRATDYTVYENSEEGRHVGILFADGSWGDYDIDDNGTVYESQGNPTSFTLPAAAKNSNYAIDTDPTGKREVVFNDKDGSRNTFPIDDDGNFYSPDGKVLGRLPSWRQTSSLDEYAEQRDISDYFAPTIQQSREDLQDALNDAGWVGDSVIAVAIGVRDGALEYLKDLMSSTGGKLIPGFGIAATTHEVFMDVIDGHLKDVRDRVRNNGDAYAEPVQADDGVPSVEAAVLATDGKTAFLSPEGIWFYVNQSGYIPKSGWMERWSPNPKDPQNPIFEVNPNLTTVGEISHENLMKALGSHALDGIKEKLPGSVGEISTKAYDFFMDIVESHKQDITARVNSNGDPDATPVEDANVAVLATKGYTTFLSPEGKWFQVNDPNYLPKSGWVERWIANPKEPTNPRHEVNPNGQAVGTVGAGNKVKSISEFVTKEALEAIGKRHGAGSD